MQADVFHFRVLQLDLEFRLPDLGRHSLDPNGLDLCTKGRDLFVQSGLRLAGRAAVNHHPTASPTTTVSHSTSRMVKRNMGGCLLGRTNVITSVRHAVRSF